MKPRTKTETAQEELDNAVLNVSRSAQDVFDEAEFVASRSYYKVPAEVMEALKSDLNRWNKASDQFMKVTREEGRK